MLRFAVAYRLFCAAILAFFSYVPLFVCYHTLRTVVVEPAKFDLTFVLVFCGSAALAYFLLLLTYRAATGRGRKADGGLLPPSVMKGFIALFGVIAIAVLGVGIWKGELAPILGGISYIGVVLAAWRRKTSERGET